MREKHAAKKIESATNTKPDVEPAKKLGFLDLPPEIRNKIYGYAIPRKQPLTLYGAPPGIMQTCRQVRAETRAMFYRNNTFVICTRHRRHKLAAEEWLSVLYPTVGTLLKEMLIVSCNVSLRLERIDGTDKWIARSTYSKDVATRSNRPLTHAEKLSVLGTVYGCRFGPPSPGDSPSQLDLPEIQGFIKNTRRYDEYADRRKLDEFVRRPAAPSTPHTAVDYLIMVATTPLLPIILGIVGIVCLTKVTKEATEKIKWKFNEPHTYRMGRSGPGWTCSRLKSGGLSNE